MEVLSFINSSVKYSCLIENVQHPANANIYLESSAKKELVKDNKTSSSS
jgi:hypothetical protein